MAGSPVEKPPHNPGGTIGEEAGDRAEQAALQRDAHIAINKAVARLPWLGAKVSPLETKSSANSSRFVQYFEHATVWAVEFATNAYEVHGDIRLRFDATGGGIGILGCPLTDEAWARDHVGRFNNFQSGSIYWTPQTKAFELYGDIGAKWHALDAEKSFLGYPLNAESSVGNGRFQTFQKGQIFWTPVSGACALPQPIADKYNSLGGPLGTLGFPVTDEIPAGNMPGTMVRFQKGKILWHAPDPASIFVSMDSTYNFSIDKIQCTTTRSRVTDTLHISATVAVFGRDPVSVTKTLGDHAEGFTFPEILLPNVALADEEIAVFAYGIMNSGHQDQTYVREKLEEGVKTLAQGAAEFAGKKAGEAIGNAIGKAVTSGAAAAVGAWIGSITGIPVPVLGPIVGAALGALTGWAVGQLIDVLNPNCDGLVASAANTVGGMDLREMISQNRPFRKVDTSPGSDSPAGCGANSMYFTSWSASVELTQYDVPVCTLRTNKMFPLIHNNDSRFLMVTILACPETSQHVPKQMTGVHLAAYSRLTEMTSILLKIGYQSDCKDTYGRTPLSLAAADGHEAVVRLLVDRADVEADSKDGFGQTPLS